MSDAQASRFAAEYSIVAPTYTDSTGLAVNVFRHNETGKIVLAVRGTEGLIDRDFLEDTLLGIGGIARTQLISLYNYVQRLISPANQLALQVEDVPPDIDPITGHVNDPGGIRETDSVAGLGYFAGVSGITVTGHSLGGHLAAAMSRLFPSLVTDTYTYNAPGFNLSVADGLLDQFPTDAGAFPGNITNVVADTGITVIPNVGDLPGTPQRIFIEDQSLITNFPGNHGIGPLTDALAVYNLFATIDPALNGAGGIDKISAILEASASNEAKSLESTLDALRTVFEEGYTRGSADNCAATTSTDNRETLYKNLYDLQTHLKTLPWYNSDPAVKALSGFTVESLVSYQQTPSALAQLAQNEVAYRYALYKLNPFVITGNATDQLYNVINGDGALNLYNPQARTGNITDAYLDDRAEFLAEKIGSALSNLEYQNKAWNANGGDLTYFRDYASNFELFAGLDESVDPLPINDADEVHFGSDRADAITGGNQNDWLYGMDGDDILTGGNGDDYVEGGQGHDTYNIGQGHDTILDTDGQGLLRYVAGGREQNLILGVHETGDPDGQYHSPDGTFTYQWSGTPNTDLGITLDGQDRIAVQDHDAGDRYLYRLAA